MLVHHRVPSMKRLGVLLLPPDGRLVDRSVLLGLPNGRRYYTEWRETMWSKVSCLIKQHDGRDPPSNRDSAR